MLQIDILVELLQPESDLCMHRNIRVHGIMILSFFKEIRKIFGDRKTIFSFHIGHASFKIYKTITQIMYLLSKNFMDIDKMTKCIPTGVISKTLQKLNKVAH
jgi:hypothetical protein